MKKVFITNGSGGNGKDTFANFLDKYISVFKYSSIDLVKDMYEHIGIDRNNKTEKKRKLYSDTKDLLTKYDDIPFKDVASIVADFKNNYIEADVLLIDIREPEEIEKAKIAFNAETILIKNDRVDVITSNDGDAGVFDYAYDYIIENNGTLEEFKENIRVFVDEIILQCNL